MIYKPSVVYDCPLLMKLIAQKYHVLESRSMMLLHMHALGVQLINAMCVTSAKTAVVCVMYCDVTIKCQLGHVQMMYNLQNFTCACKSVILIGSILNLNIICFEQYFFIPIDAKINQNSYSSTLATCGNLTLRQGHTSV